MRKKQIAKSAAAAAVPFMLLMLGGCVTSDVMGAAVEITRRTALLAAGADYRFPSLSAGYGQLSAQNHAEQNSQTTEISSAEAFAESGEQSEVPAEGAERAENAVADESSVVSRNEGSAAEIAAQPPVLAVPDYDPIIEGVPNDMAGAQVITQNAEEFDDGLDYSAAGKQSGGIVREHLTASAANGYIELQGGGFVRNNTAESAERLLAASGQLPDFTIELNNAVPQVLIVHTHTTESFQPYARDYYDDDFPSNTRDNRHNIVAVGDVLAQTLAENGVSVIHDCTVHDYPNYTGAYDRSEETIRAVLEKYPTIEVVIDLHRDAFEDESGKLVAPIAEIDGKTAAQFMIITGCENEYFDIPNYIENFKLASLIQSTAESLYSGLSRPILFDYRNYNQHLTTGSLLIEVGTNANSLDEALYTGELLGNVLGAALSELVQ